MGMFDTSMVRYIMDSLDRPSWIVRPPQQIEWPVKTSKTKVWEANVSGRKIPMADWCCPHCATWNDSQLSDCAKCSMAVSDEFRYGYSLGCEDVKQLLLKSGVAKTP